MSDTVTLEWYEFAHATLVGLLRHLNSRHAGIQDQSFENRFPWWTDILGAAAEIALGKHTGKYCAGHVDTFDEPDIWPDIEVRYNSRENGKLFLRTYQKIYPDRRYVLVRGQMPEFEIVGWILGADGMQPGWLRDPGDRGKECYIVPVEALKPVVVRKEAAREKAAQS